MPPNDNLINGKSRNRTENKRGLKRPGWKKGFNIAETNHNGCLKCVIDDPLTP